jgi:MoaA/NifB/PqqE/SkfB family radical SAM enzyme
MELALVSNGVIFKPETIPLLLQATWVRFSVDAGNPESYTRIRNVSAKHHDRMWKNVTDLAAEKKRTGSDLTIGMGFVVTDDNWSEVGQFTELAKKAGVDNVRISAVFQPDNEKYFDQFFDKAAELCRETKEKYEDENFIVFNNFGERYADLAQAAPDYSFCGYQELVTYIGGDLNVYRCCVTAYNQQGMVGSLADQRFKDLWNSEQKKKNFSCFDAKSCDRCMFNNKNKTILYAIDSDPQHVNFV